VAPAGTVTILAIGDSSDWVWTMSAAKLPWAATTTHAVRPSAKSAECLAIDILPLFGP
jgi:hypothetical protein